MLITHDCDSDIPGSFLSLLDDPKILAWFGINATHSHPKLFPIPIGLPQPLSLPEKKNKDKTHLLYLNFESHNKERKKVRDLFEKAPFCTISEPKKLSEYLQDLAQSQFVLSPLGAGIDCYRTWEALLMGAIPIVRTSPLDPLYADLPILIVDEWEQITPEYLEAKYREFASRSYEWEQLTMDYWIEKIKKEAGKALPPGAAK